MELSNLITTEMIFPEIISISRWEAISEMMDGISTKIYLEEKEKIIKAIEERERLGNTAIIDRVAFPHARTNLLDRFILAMGISREGINFETEKNIPVNIIFLFVTPENITRSYLETLSALSRLLHIDGIIDRFLGSKNKEEIFQIIKDAHVVIEISKVARDIMVSEVITAKPDTTLRELINLLAYHNIAGMPVINDNREVVGLITERELINAFLPKLKTFFEDMEFYTRKETLINNLIGKEHIKVKNIMNTIVLCISEETRVSEIITTMLTKNLRSLPVVKEGKLVGLVGLADILRNVIRKITAS